MSEAIKVYGKMEIGTCADGDHAERTVVVDPIDVPKFSFVPGGEPLLLLEENGWLNLFPSAQAFHVDYLPGGQLKVTLTVYPDEEGAEVYAFIGEYGYAEAIQWYEELQ